MCIYIYIYTHICSLSLSLSFSLYIYIYIYIYSICTEVSFAQYYELTKQLRMIIYAIYARTPGGGLGQVASEFATSG